MKKVNLGAGDKPLQGYLNLDIKADKPGIDIAHDLNFYPWPFDDNSVDEVYMDQCLEHLIDRNRAMREIHRILKPGAEAILCVPHFTWQYAYTDPTHRHFFAYNTFFYYVNKGGYFDFRFSSCKVRLIFSKRISFWNILLEPLFNLFPDIYEQSILRAFPALKIKAILVK